MHTYNMPTNGNSPEYESQRDLFAAHLASGILASAEGLDQLTKDARTAAFDSIANIVYEMADALMRARSK